MHRDIRITISFFDRIHNIGREMFEDPTDCSPGWYVRAYQNEGYDDIVKYRRISDQEAMQFAFRIDPKLGGRVDALNKSRRAERVQRLSEIPAEIKRLETLKARLEEEVGA